MGFWKIFQTESRRTNIMYRLINRLCDAIDSNNLKTAKTLIRRNPHLLNHTIPSIQLRGKLCMLIHKAADQHNPDFVSLLLTNGADVNAKDSCGQTPLCYAYEYEVAQLLLNHGADVNSKDHIGRTPLYGVSEGVAQLLLDLGADVNVRDDGGDTPLHHAGSGYVAQLLLDRKADIHAKNNEGRTPLHLKARYSAYEDVVQLLLDRKADIHAKDNEGGTPLHLAAKYASHGTAKILLRHGADCTAIDNKGRTPLHYVDLYDDNPYLSSRGDNITRITKLLIGHGADITAKDNQGNTPSLSGRFASPEKLLSIPQVGKTEAAQWLSGGGGSLSNLLTTAQSGTMFQEIHEEHSIARMKVLATYMLSGIDVNESFIDKNFEELWCKIYSMMESKLCAKYGLTPKEFSVLAKKALGLS